MKDIIGCKAIKKQTIEWQIKEFNLKMISVNFPIYLILVDRKLQIRDESLTSFSPLATVLIHLNTPSTRCNKHQSQRYSPHHDESLCSAAVLSMMVAAIQTPSMISNLERNTVHIQRNESKQKYNHINSFAINGLPNALSLSLECVPLLFANTCS